MREGDYHDFLGLCQRDMALRTLRLQHTWLAATGAVTHLTDATPGADGVWGLCARCGSHKHRGLDAGLRAKRDVAYGIGDGEALERCARRTNHAHNAAQRAPRL